MATKKKSEQQAEGITEPSYVPDIPAQMMEDAVPIPIVEEKKEEVINEILPVVEYDRAIISDEVTFLKRILSIQEEGGFGKHLHDIINERIKQIS